jgi:glycine dehydrogenase
VRLGFDVRTRAFFDTLVVATASDRAIVARAVARVQPAPRATRSLGISLDETTTRDDVARSGGSSPARRRRFRVDAIDASTTLRFPTLADSRRSSTIRCSTASLRNAMLRYLRALADRDLALDRSMIPLGSCTMKLNATSEMIP